MFVNMNDQTENYEGQFLYGTSIRYYYFVNVYRKKLMGFLLSRNTFNLVGVPLVFSTSLTIPMGMSSFHPWYPSKT